MDFGFLPFQFDLDSNSEQKASKRRQVSVVGLIKSVDQKMHMDMVEVKYTAQHKSDKLDKFAYKF